MTRWHISNADILDVDADGLICSANPNLNLSGGVGGAFLLRYGSEMQDFLYDYLRSSNQRVIKPGTAIVAPSFGSRFTAIAHAVAIDVFYDTNADLIRATYESAINQLAAASCRTIAAACLACGYGRCSTQMFLRAITPLIANSFNGIDTITLATTNTELANDIAEFISRQKS
jgi:O-acetyl-ADP-ribose deacetylase (regulator of RNase III)